MNAQMKSFSYSVLGILGGLVILDLFGIAEQGSLKVAHRGKLGRKAVNVKDTLTGSAVAEYQ